MKPLVVLFCFFSVLIASSLTYLFYVQTQELNSQKKALFKANYEIIKLQTEYDNYKERTENLRQIRIAASSPNSKAQKIGDVMYTYANAINGDLSLYYKNLSTGDFVVVDESRNYYMASLYKVILTLYILEEVKNGKIKLTDKTGNPPITIQDALDKIIAESNNEYAISLGDHYGWENIEKAMQKKLNISFSLNTKLEANIQTMGTLFEDIALSLKITDDESNYMLGLLNDQKKTSKLPKYLPKNIYSHNKTGEFDDYSHDAGIFYTPKANYILIFMSKTENPGITNEQMTKMSQEIYKILNPPAN